MYCFCVIVLLVLFDLFCLQSTPVIFLEFSRTNELFIIIILQVPILKYTVFLSTKSQWMNKQNIYIISLYRMLYCTRNKACSIVFNRNIKRSFDYIDMYANIEIHCSLLIYNFNRFIACMVNVTVSLKTSLIICPNMDPVVCSWNSPKIQIFLYDPVDAFSNHVFFISILLLTNKTHNFYLVCQ